MLQVFWPEGITKWLLINLICVFPPGPCRSTCVSQVENDTATSGRPKCSKHQPKRSSGLISRVCVSMSRIIYSMWNSFPHSSMYRVYMGRIVVGQGVVCSSFPNSPKPLLGLRIIYHVQVVSVKPTSWIIESEGNDSQHVHACEFQCATHVWISVTSCRKRKLNYPRRDIPCRSSRHGAVSSGVMTKSVVTNGTPMSFRIRKGDEHHALPWRKRAVAPILMSHPWQTYRDTHIRYNMYVWLGLSSMIARECLGLSHPCHHCWVKMQHNSNMSRSNG